MNIGKIHLKVCGMRDTDNIHRIAAICPDYLGFIFYPSSPRYVGDSFTIPRDIHPVKKVGVFVNATIDEMMKQVDTHDLDIIQLHGGEPVETARQLKEHGVPVWKVFSLDDSFDFARTIPFEGVADMFLFDTKGKYHGGNAVAFDWSILSQYHQRVPFMLSGGITPANVNGIASLSGMNLHGIDINSGVEISPGWKDPGKVRQIAALLLQLNSEK